MVTPMTFSINLGTGLTVVPTFKIRRPVAKPRDRRERRDHFVMSRTGDVEGGAATIRLPGLEPIRLRW